MSCVARALPAKTVWIQPSRISAATWGTDPVCTIAGPPTSEYLLAGGAGLADGLGHALEADGLGLLAGNRGAHEAEERGLARPLDGKHAHPRVADHDGHAKRHMDHRHAAGHSRRRIECDAAVHLLVLHVDPAALEANLRALVGRAIEGVRKGTRDVGGNRARIFGVNRRGTMLDQVADDRVDRLGAVGPDADPRVARVGSANADLALVDLEAAAHLQDAIEDLGQQERVDNVAANLDLVDDPRCGRWMRSLRLRPRPLLS